MAKNPLLKQQVLMANKGKIKVKRPKKWLYPMPAERQYQKRLIEINKIFYDQVKAIILPELPNLVAQSKSTRVDDSRLDNSTWVDQLKQLVDKTYITFQSIVTPSKISNIASEQAESISVMNKQQFVKVIHSSLSVNPIVQEPFLQTQLKLFQNQNTDLITKLGSDQKERVQQTLYSNLSQGNGIEKIQEELSKSEGIGENRAKLIARDQTNKFNGQLTQLRQQELGITSYVWTTSQDERVRPTHKVLDGEVFTWEKGPKIGHPGSEINCRCIAQPVITDAMFDTDSSVPIVEQEQKPKVETAISSIEGFKIESQVKTIKYSDKFNKEDLIGLNEYQLVYDGKVGGYRNINNFLRKNKLFDEKIPVENVKEYISKIDSAINKGIIIEDTKLYRGVLNGSEYKDLKVGEVFSNKSFLSTTTEKTLAENWAYKKNDDEFPVIFNIIAKKGTNAVYMLDGNALDTIYMRDRKKSSYIYEEKEVLLKRNQKFKVLKTDSKNGYLEITVETD